MDASTIEAALALWPDMAGGRAELVNLSENHTFRIDGPSGPSILRVHRPGYQSPRTIDSELAWLVAVRDALPVPRPIEGLDRAFVQQVADHRSAVMFSFEPGTEPSETGVLGPLFMQLGRLAALAHRHVEGWRLPPGFERATWSAEAILDADGLWGDWRTAPGVAGEVRSALAAIDRRLRGQLHAYGTTGDRFGLIHADMRLANLLVDGDRVTLIDFDDCGFGWFVYDLAASLSFIETRSDLRVLIDSWIAGYREVRALADDHIAMIPAMILLRRMALVAWIGSHGETGLAQRHAPRFAVDTVELVRRLLP